MYDVLTCHDYYPLLPPCHHRVSATGIVHKIVDDKSVREDVDPLQATLTDRWGDLLDVHPKVVLLTKITDGQVCHRIKSVETVKQPHRDWIFVHSPFSSLSQ